MFLKCPGQDDRNITAEMIPCPGCGYEIEIFSDEVKVSCRRCGSPVCNKRLPSCLDWCKSARECIGNRH
ncbi:MAG: phosphohydrolase [Candidatus Omnitrophota bacterium]